MHGGRQKPAASKVKLFPTLEWDDIFNCLMSLNIYISPAELQKPTPASAQSLWLQILENFTGASPEMLDAPRLALLGTMEYQDIYSDTMSILMLYKRCRWMLDCFNIPGFTIMDLTRPDPRNQREILSGLLNFAKFRESLSDVTGALQGEANDTYERVNVLRKRLDTIDADIKDIEAKNLEDEPRAEELRQQNVQLRAELHGLQGEVKKMQLEHEGLRAQRTACLEDVEAMQRELVQIQQQTREAKSRIVRSPERIKRHISDMSSTVANDRQMYASLVAKNRDLAKRLEVYNGLETQLRGLIDLEKEIETQRSVVEEGRKKVAQLRSAVEHASIEGESLGERTNQLDRQIKNAEDRLARQLKIIQDSRAEAEAKIEALKIEYVERSKDRQVQSKQRDRLAAEQREVVKKRKAFIQESEDEMNELMAQYWSLRKEAEDYMKTLSVQLGLETYGFYL